MGDNPISTYTPSGLSMSQIKQFQIGFVIHADLNGLEYTAWHDNNDATDLWDWYNLGEGVKLRTNNRLCVPS